MYSGKKILFVDDDMDFLEATQLMLLDKGFDVVTASNGAEAIAKYKEIKPDIVFLDIKMPEINGYDAFFKIVALDSDARIVFISSYGLDDEKIKRARSMCLKGLLNKPLEFIELERMIKKHSK